MKLFYGGSTLLLLIFLSTLDGGLTSCTKDKTLYDTVTVIHNDTTTVNHTDTLTITDTVALRDTFLTEAMLTLHDWKLFEVRAILEGTPMYYLRGGVSNTQSFDNEFTTFNADHTGAVVDNALATHAMTNWEFLNPEHTKLIFTLSNFGTVYSDYTYENIRYKNGNLYYDCYYKDNLTGGNYHGQEIRIPK